MFLCDAIVLNTKDYEFRKLSYTCWNGGSSVSCKSYILPLAKQIYSKHFKGNVKWKFIGR